MSDKPMHTPGPWRWGNGWDQWEQDSWDSNEEYAGPKYADIGLYAGGKAILPLRIDHWNIEWDSPNGLADLRPEDRRLIAAAPTNAELAGIGRELAEAVLDSPLEAFDTRYQPSSREWNRIVELARRFMETAGAKEDK